MVTKRQALLAICEQPGWRPQGYGEIACVEALSDEGWIEPRGEGWEATAKALDEFPAFASQIDIADPEATLRVAASSKPVLVDLGHTAVWCQRCGSMRELRLNGNTLTCTHCESVIGHTRFWGNSDA